MLQTQKYMVGYLDLLGGKSLICQDSEDHYLNIVHTCYQMAKEMVKCNSSFAAFPHSVKIFSDNIIVAIPSEVTMRNDNHPIFAINRMSAIMQALQRVLLKYDILSRGSIAYGKFYIDELMVWGEALIKAYELESNYAKYPRVIVQNRLIYFLEKLWLDDPDMILWANHIKKDADGEFFLDYLNYPKDENSRNLVVTSLQTIKSKIKNENDEKILEKLQWHKNYLSSLLDSWKIGIED